MDKTKVLYLNSAFTKELPTATDKIDSIYIEGYASTVDIDRAGDVVPSSVWEKGMTNYLKNPIILSQHDHDDPIGRMVEHKLDSNGLWIKARISAAAEVFSLIKDGVLTAFSIGFRILDAEYNSAAEVFVVKELELIEISVVSVPANQNTIFSLSKAFTDAEEYKVFKAQFIPKAESAKGLESPTDKESTITKEWKMDPKELETMLANAANAAAAQATKALLDAQAKEKAEADAKAAADAALAARVTEIVATTIKSGESGAEKLLAEVEKRFADESAKSTKMLDDLQSALKEKAAEITALQNSKMSFSGEAKGGIEYKDKETAILLSKVSGKSIEDTKFGRDLVVKYGGNTPGNHLPGSTWELEVSLNMESEVRRRLVVAPLFRSVNMQTNVMKIPVNPEAGYAQWMANSSFNSSASAGNNATHSVNDITLSSFKVATNEYIGYEEEEDSLLVILPIIRDAMIRRTAKSVDKAFLLGAGTGADPVKGLAKYDDISQVTISNATGYGTTATAKLRALRQDLGAGGLDPNDVVFIVNTETYYGLLDDTTFQTMDKVGPNATILTGQIGMVAGSPVLVSAELPANTVSTNTTGGNTANVSAMAVAVPTWLVGNQRGLRFDTQDIVSEQRKILVASLRTGMTQLTTNLGTGVSALRWVV